MRARRTEFTENVYRLAGGTEDNDLWVNITHDDHTGTKIITSVWVPTDEERLAIAAGENIRLHCWGSQVPVALDLTDEKIMGVDRDGV